MKTMTVILAVLCSLFLLAVPAEARFFRRCSGGGSGCSGASVARPGLIRGLFQSRFLHRPAFAPQSCSPAQQSYAPAPASQGYQAAPACSSCSR